MSKNPSPQLGAKPHIRNLISSITAHDDIRELATKGTRRSYIYPYRFASKQLTRKEILARIYEEIITYTKSNSGICSDIKILTPGEGNSRTFESVYVKIGESEIELIAARGQNNGEIIEDYVVRSMKDSAYAKSNQRVFMHDRSTIGDQVLYKIEMESDEHIVGIQDKKSNTRFTGLDPIARGQVIADVWCLTHSGTVLPVSIKSHNSSLGKLSISSAFSKDCFVKNNAPVFRDVLQHLPISWAKVTEGLLSYNAGVPIASYDSVFDGAGVAINAGTSLYEVMALIIGENYHYVKKLNVTKKNQSDRIFYTFVDKRLVSRLLSNARIVEVRYPRAGVRKGITIIIKSDTAKITLDIRNDHGGIIPTVMQLNVSNCDLL